MHLQAPSDREQVVSFYTLKGESPWFALRSSPSGKLPASWKGSTTCLQGLSSVNIASSQIGMNKVLPMDDVLLLKNDYRGRSSIVFLVSSTQA